VPLRPKGVEPLGAILGRVVDRRGRIRGCSAEELMLAWRRAAGEGLGKRTKVTGLRGGVLQVAVNSGVLLQQLVGFRHDELVKALQEQFHRTYVKKIKFSLAARSGRPSVRGVER
jgi:predicted nucleic acid-binding Zn ribbon protein